MYPNPFHQMSREERNAQFKKATKQWHEDKFREEFYSELVEEIRASLNCDYMIDIRRVDAPSMHSPNMHYIDYTYFTYVQGYHSPLTARDFVRDSLPLLTGVLTRSKWDAGACQHGSHGLVKRGIYQGPPTTPTSFHGVDEPLNGESLLKRMKNVIYFKISVEYYEGHDFTRRYSVNIQFTVGQKIPTLKDFCFAAMKETVSEDDLKRLPSDLIEEYRSTL